MVCFFFVFVFLVKSFIALSRELLENGVPYILSEKFSQDPLEEHFCRHRSSIGSGDNPSLAVFQRQEVSLNLIRQELISDLRGNTEGRPEQRPKIRVDDTRLPRKRLYKPPEGEH